MFCDRCGTKLNQGATYCSKCGKPVGVVPLMPARGRITGHARLLGILWLAFSAFRLVPGLVLLLIFGHRWGIFPPEVPGFVHVLLPGIGMFFLASSLIGFAAGVGLLCRQPWARMLALVWGGINLIDLPFGTALGVYTLWVLLPAESEDEYRHASRVA